MHKKEQSVKNILAFGIHGAVGTLAGLGVGLLFSELILGFIFSIISMNSRIFIDYPILSRLMQPAVSIYIFIFAIFGAYIGYIFEGKEKAMRLSGLGAVAGILAGIAEAGYMEWTRISGETGQMAFYPIILAIAGLIFGIPRTRKMVLLVISGALGGAVGYGIYLLSLNLKFYLIYLKVGLPAIILAFFLLLLAIVIPGAFISIGMYFIEGITSLPKEIPRFLKITRNIGVALAIILLLVSSLISAGMSNYGSTSSSIQISSDGGGKVTLYVPVFLDDKEKVLEMYEKPSIKGTATTAIIDTGYGKALKISGAGRIELTMEQTHVRFIKGDSRNYFEGLKLSMSNYTRSEVIKDNQIDAWVYSEDDGAVLNYQIKQDSGGGRIMDIHTEERLSKGWQEIKLSETSIMYD